MSPILRLALLLGWLALAANALAVTATVVSGNGQTTRSGTYFAQPVVVEVREDSGAALPGVEVDFRVQSGSPGVSNATRVTDLQGRASFEQLIAMGPAGTASFGVFVRRSALDRQGVPDIGQLHITGARPARVELLSGTSQSAPLNGPFARPVLARVIDELGAPLPKAVVRFWIQPEIVLYPESADLPRAYFDSGDGTYAFIAADDQGIAVSPTFQANQWPGTWQMFVSAVYSASPFDAYIYTRMLNAYPLRGMLTATREVVDTDGSELVDISVRLLTPEGLPFSGQTIGFRAMTGAEEARPGTAITDSQGYASTRVHLKRASSEYQVVAFWQDQLVPIKVRLIEAGASTEGVQGLWWAGPGENGWGISIAQSGDNLFAAVFAYGASGNPDWHVMSSGHWNSARTVFSGLLYAPKGSAFFAYDAARLQVGPPVGVATFTFTGPGTADLELTIDGVTIRKSISRQVFGAGATTGPAVGGLWWGGAAQNGWGLSIAQQGAELFSVWYTYDAGGNRVWYVLPGGDWTSSTTYEGRIYQTSGATIAAYDPARLRVIDVGSYRLRFENDAATFEYAIEGRSGTLTLARQPF